MFIWINKINNAFASHLQSDKYNLYLAYLKEHYLSKMAIQTLSL
ncbi:hypothetical protein PLUTE_a5222 [Pseudoalteromonas luteoviolacea DSM 6061]|nr:hypothetical protein [Pseudoalteromonas luteoviolacea DSM 6061]